MTPEEFERSMQFIRRSQENTARQIGRLSKALVELTKAEARTQGALTRLAESQMHGDRRLDTLIDVVRGG